jgi:V8-like Glu-specific endopeptidase
MTKATLVALGLVAAALAPQAAGAAVTNGPLSSGRQGTQSAAAERKVLAYWTPERMRTAVPIDTIPAARGPIDRTKVDPGVEQRFAPVTPDAPPGATNAPVWPGSGTPPATTTGKVFFTKVVFGQDVGTYSCSGSIVNSEGLDTVITAGHCVHAGPGGNWAKNWVFVPGYKDGQKPYGVWTAHHFWTLKGWSKYGDHRYDVAFSVMNTLGGKHIVNKFGGQGIVTGLSPLTSVNVLALGYPANAPYDGAKLRYCQGTAVFDLFGDQTMRMACDMHAGSSGGPWLAFFNGTWGYVNSVNAYHYPDELVNEYGPYFGSAVWGLFGAARFD